jgi:dihydrofolate reductase
MAKVRVHNFSISLDGYGAGPDQTLDQPLGVGGEQLHDWGTSTRSWRAAHAMEGGVEGGIDDEWMARGTQGIGATIMGRNMFGPVRGEWRDDPWRGWWGDDPPFHHPVFVLTHHGRDPIDMAGGTTFYFVTDGIEAALERAREAAGRKDVQVSGGASTIQQYLRAGLIDEMHIAIAPVLLGGGVRLFDDVGTLPGYKVVEVAGSGTAIHVRWGRA